VHLYRARALRAAGGAAAALAESVVAASAAAAAGQEGLAASALALEAELALAAGDRERALARSELALAKRDALGGAEDDAEIFVARAAALAASGRESEAESTRARGAERVREIAARITSPEWRRLFLEKVPAHRALLGQRSSSSGSE
jgi:hypothetical protein